MPGNTSRGWQSQSRMGRDTLLEPWGPAGRHLHSFLQLSWRRDPLKWNVLHCPRRLKLPRGRSELILRVLQRSNL
jgi:hypothetical protein